MHHRWDQWEWRLSYSAFVLHWRNYYRGEGRVHIHISSVPGLFCPGSSKENYRDMGRKHSEVIANWKKGTTSSYCRADTTKGFFFIFIFFTTFLTQKTEVQGHMKNWHETRHDPVTARCSASPSQALREDQKADNDTHLLTGGGVS